MKKHRLIQVLSQILKIINKLKILSLVLINIKADNIQKMKKYSINKTVINIIKTKIIFYHNKFQKIQIPPKIFKIRI